MAVSAVKALEKLGIKRPEECGRVPQQVAALDFESSHWIVALKKTEHVPLMEERFPDWSEKVEYWHVDDVPDIFPLIEKEVMDLVARLLRGGKPRSERGPEPLGAETKVIPRSVVAKQAVVKIGRETKGRKGKGVTIISDAPLDETGLNELATLLKSKVGTGGTVKDGRIEIQGDQRDRLTVELEKLGYKVKRAGG